MNQRPILSTLSKPAPSKWDDAQKWLVGMSHSVDQGYFKTSKPRKSNADERKHDFQKSRNSGEVKSECVQVVNLEIPNSDGETKKIDGDVSFWLINKTIEDSSTKRSVCVRDVGTEVTPIGSLEPSRTATPLRATLSGSPRNSTPVQRSQGVQATEGVPVVPRTSGSTDAVIPSRYSFSGTGWEAKDEEESDATKILQKNNSERDRRILMLEKRAMAWDEAERAKYMARYKREEVKIQAWENSQKRRAEAEMRKVEVKVERMTTKAQERLKNKLAVTERKADRKRANAEAKMNEQAVKTTEKSSYLRRTGHFPASFFSTKFPSFCWSS